jgi:hypothetical protein
MDFAAGCCPKLNERPAPKAQVPELFGCIKSMLDILPTDFEARTG